MYKLTSNLNIKMTNNHTDITIPQQTSNLRNCEECLNHETLIVDTNFLLFLMDFISEYHPGIDSQEFLAKLTRYFNQSRECSVDGCLYVSERVFKYELNVNYNPKSALNTNSQFLENNECDDKRNDLVDLLKNSIDKLSVNQNDLDKIIIIGGTVYGMRSPKMNDLSLVTLGLNLSNERTSKCLILTDDEKLKELIKNHIIPKGKIEKANGDEWESASLFNYHILDFLLKIFSCCKLSYDEASNMISYYGEHFLLKRWKELGDELKEIKSRYISYYSKVFYEYIKKKYQIED